MNDFHPRPDNWRYQAFSVHKFVDDFLGHEKMFLGNSRRTLSANKENVKIHAQRSQLFYESVAARAEKIGMRLNAQKTQLLCISALTSANVSSYIRIGDDRIQSQATLKQLGFTFSTTPSPAAYLEVVALKFRKRLWILRHLRQAGIPPNDLLALYRSLLLPILDYAAIVYHSMLSAQQRSDMEHLQSFMGLVCLCTSHMRTQDTLSCLE